jgi:hypothetical protein
MWLAKSRGILTAQWFKGAKGCAIPNSAIFPAEFTDPDSIKSPSNPGGIKFT